MEKYLIYLSHNPPRLHKILHLISGSYEGLHVSRTLCVPSHPCSVWTLIKAVSKFRIHQQSCIDPRYTTRPPEPSKLQNNHSTNSTPLRRHRHETALPGDDPTTLHRPLVLTNIPTARYSPPTRNCTPRSQPVAPRVRIRLKNSPLLDKCVYWYHKPHPSPPHDPASCFSLE